MKAFPFIKDNIDTLRQADAPIYQWLSTARIDFEGLPDRVFTNPRDLLDIRLPEGIGMFERIHPVQAYADWLPEDKADTSATIVVGTNLGYGINHLLTKVPDSHKIIVIEPNADILLMCLGQTDYRQALALKKLFFVPPDQSYFVRLLQQLDLQYLYGRIYLRPDVPSQQIGPEYAQWTKFCREALENFSVELNTLRLRQDVMVGNELANFRRAMRDGSLKAMPDTAKGVGAVILGAGPSLTRFAPQLAANPGNAVYVTALQTLPALRGYDLKPHFCMAIDYSEGMLNVYNRLDKEWARDIPLIYSTKIRPDVLEAYPGPTLPLWTIGGVSTYVMGDDEFIIDAGGNVSVTLMRFLAICGVSHYLLVGQDFAWSGDKSHVDGHHAANDGFVFDPQRHVRLKNRKGEVIHSAMSYVTSLREMENDIAGLGLSVLNLYGDGVDIKGTRAVTYQEALMDGAFSSVPGAMTRFLEALAAAHAPRPWPKLRPHSAEVRIMLRDALRVLEKHFRKLGKRQQEVNTTLEQALNMVRADTLYNPYLYTEIIDLAGLVRAKKSYAPKDIGDIKSIFARIRDKISRMDACITPASA